MNKTKRFRIGNQTSYSAPSLTLPFEYAIEKEFAAFEWFPDKKESGEGWDTEDINPEQRQVIKNRSNAACLRLSIHLPWQANPLTPVFSDIAQQNLAFAKDIGASVLIFHLYNDEGIEEFLQAILPFIREASEAGVDLAIENTPLTGPDDFNFFFRLLRNQKNIDTSHVGMCLDIGHANICSATRNNYLHFIDRLDPHVFINHVHLHENFGDADTHLPLFTGPSSQSDEGIKGVLARLEKRGFSGSLIFEQWPDNPDLLDQAYNGVNRILASIPVHTKKTTTPHSISHSDHVPKGDFLQKLVQADKNSRNWREKLTAFEGIINHEDFSPENDNLAYLAIYIRFLGVGEIICTEDGRHFRPNHHAKISKSIEKRLVSITTPQNSFIIRKIYPWIPSHHSDFMRAEPLTRIRDIAHRNDIPHDLKSEIKHTLQNKLHRSAGPEDLATSEALLKRITAHGTSYSPPFVEEFSIFHNELKDFFNANSLDDQLHAMIQRGEVSDEKSIKKFFHDKRDIKEDVQGLNTVLESLTQVRNSLQTNKEHPVDATTQAARLADIGLEDFAFSLVGRVANLVEGHKGSLHWEIYLHTVVHTVENVALSDVESEECSPIGAELLALCSKIDPSNQNSLLRLKAALTRCQRITDEYSDRVLALFPDKVETLGTLLGVQEHAITYYSEGDIRANIIFQLSRLTSCLLKKIREQAGLSHWDILMAGCASGKALVRENMETDLEEGQDVILILDSVEGDEEIPEEVRGIVIAHSLPHLSHLGIRARQQNVAFVICEDRELFKDLHKHQDRMITLHARPDTVTIEESLSSSGKKKNKKQKPLIIPEIDLSGGSMGCHIRKITQYTGGGKAYGAMVLQKLASLPESDFQTPSSFVLPFSVMEDCLKENTDFYSFYSLIQDKLNKLSQTELDETLTRLQKEIKNCAIPDILQEQIINSVYRGKKLIVRSSSNSEDLEHMTGAGLYDSIANVSETEILDAVRTVWASLWSKRAVLTRKKIGIPHKKVSMAILIQEMISPEISFVAHTVNPLSGNKDELYLELALGLCDALTSGSIKGEPYKIVFHKKRKEIRTLAYANLSHALFCGNNTDLEKQTVDYSKVSLTTDDLYREKLCKRIAECGLFLEKQIGSPQDIEGVVKNDDIFIVQSRAQQI